LGYPVNVDGKQQKESNMRKVVVTEFLSLDGVMEDPGGAEKFEHGGWTRSYWSDEIGQFKFEELMASDALLLGRVTYQGFAAAWPSQKDEGGFADKMNNMNKYVVSTTLDKAEWNNSHLIKSNVAEEISKLKQQPGENILVNGSARLIQTLIQHKLVDEYRLLVYPVVLGSGKRLFQGGTKTDLKLVESKPFVSAGVVSFIYQTTQSQ
jgi:dihydrofolate reductase